VPKKNPIKKMTLRQQLRAQAEEKLKGLREQMNEAAVRVVDGVDIKPSDLMRLCLGGQTKTVHEHLITELANQAEAELLNLWNNQQALDLGDDNAKDAD